MRILRPVVLPATEIMPLRQAEIVQRSTVRWQFVGDEGIGEHIFNIAKAEGKPEIQPDGVRDD